VEMTHKVGRRERERRRPEKNTTDARPIFNRRKRLRFMLPFFFMENATQECVLHEALPGWRAPQRKRGRQCEGRPYLIEICPAYRRDSPSDVRSACPLALCCLHRGLELTEDPFQRDAATRHPVFFVPMRSMARYEVLICRFAPV